MTRGERGQATVEFALVLPVLVLVALLVVQVALVVRAQLLVHEAAREAARVASVEPEPAPAAAAAAAVVAEAEVRIARGAVGDPVRATVTLRYVTDVPLVGALSPDVTLRATGIMRAER